MFRRKKRTPTMPIPPTSTYGGSASTAVPLGSFRLGTDLYDLVTSPAGWQAMLDPRNPVLTLYRPRGGAVEFDLRAFPRGRWVALGDDDGRQLPMEVMVGAGGVQGRWIDVPVERAARETDGQVSDDERRLATEDAFQMLQQRHSVAMGQIYGIQ